MKPLINTVLQRSWELKEKIPEHIAADWHNLHLAFGLARIDQQAAHLG